MLTAGAAGRALVALAVVAASVGPWKADASPPSPETLRVSQLKDAVSIRYGTNGRRGDAAAALEILRKLAEGPVDAVTIHAWHEMGKIHLFGYQSYYFWRRRDASQAMDLFRKAADRNHAPSQFYLSFTLMAEGSADPAPAAQKAAAYLKRAAGQSYTPALLALGYQKLYGVGCAVDVDGALALYKRAFRLREQRTKLLSYLAPTEELRLTEQNAQAFRNAIERDLGAEERQTKDAIRYWEPKAAEGDGLAMYELAKLMEDNPDAEEAVAQLYQRASEKGVVAAMRDVGLCYMHGIGVPLNAEKAVQHLAAAVEQGDHEAAKFLGYIYYTGVERPQEGKPVKRDDELAAKYFWQAAKQEIPEAMYFVGELLSKRGKGVIGMRPQQQMQNAYSMYRSAADYGLTQAMVREAEMLEKGIGVRRNLNRAALLYKALAENSFAVHTLTQSLYAYVENDYVASFVHNALAAFVGVQAGQFNVGQLYVNGRGMHRLDNARRLARSSLSQGYVEGDVTALRLLGRLAEQEGQREVASELYTKGFTGGDLECIDPLIALFAADRRAWTKAIHLLQYKQYRRARNTDGAPPGVRRTLEGLSTWCKINQLKARRAITRFVFRDSQDS